MLNLHTCTPASQVDLSNPRELIEAATALPEWDEHACIVIDYLLMAWTMREVSRGPSQAGENLAGLHELSVAITTLLSQLPNSFTLPERWRYRWEAYQSIVGARILIIVGPYDRVDPNTSPA